ncbi:MAG: 3',5'-cyclic AMP phosphodiesterase CpdA [Myxococcota bacterium]|jgi:3',5'-cyclic AMP phosphodiesterase CpdA
MRIAQLSDLHILDLESVRLTDFFSKRLTGGINLLTRRRNAHPLELAERLIEDVSKQAPDHVVVTGDVTNLSLPGEFQRASRLLRALGGFPRLTVIPGNHDVYTAGAERQQRFEAYFGELLFGEEFRPGEHVYPAIKDVGDAVIVGLSSAIKTKPFYATGRIGEEQLGRVVEALSAPEMKDRFKVVLLHHNLHTRGARADAHKGLLDRAVVLEKLQTLGVDLVLHGHTHRAHRFAVTRDDHTMLVIGSGSSTQNTDDPDMSARYNIYTIDGKLRRIRTRVFDRQRRRFEWLV